MTKTHCAEQPICTGQAANKQDRGTSVLRNEKRADNSLEFAQEAERGDPNPMENTNLVLLSLLLCA